MSQITQEVLEQALNNNISPVYRYTVRNTGYNSNTLGDCEVCGKHVSEVFSQIEERQYINPVRGLSWTHAGCHSLFGHESCLKSKQVA